MGWWFWWSLLSLYFDETLVINEVLGGPYKWPKIFFGNRGNISPPKSVELWAPTYNWFFGVLAGENGKEREKERLGVSKMPTITLELHVGFDQRSANILV